MKSIFSLVVVLITGIAATVQAVPKTVAEQVTVNSSNISFSSKTNVQGVLEDLDKAVADSMKLRTPYYSVKVDQSGTLNSPSGFTNLLTEYRYPSYGSIMEPRNDLRNFDQTNSLLYSMKVCSAYSCTNTLKLFAIDDFIYIYINGALSWSYTNIFSSASNPVSVPISLPAGTSTVQIIKNDFGGMIRSIELLGDVVNSSNVWFVGE